MRFLNDRGIRSEFDNQWAEDVGDEEKQEKEREYTHYWRVLGINTICIICYCDIRTGGEESYDYSDKSGDKVRPEGETIILANERDEDYSKNSSHQKNITHRPYQKDVKVREDQQYWSGEVAQEEYGEGHNQPQVTDVSVFSVYKCRHSNCYYIEQYDKSHYYQ